MLTWMPSFPLWKSGCILNLKARPVIVGADPKGGIGRGVVSSASYEARKFVIRSAMQE